MTVLPGKNQNSWLCEHVTASKNFKVCEQLLRQLWVAVPLRFKIHPLSTQSKAVLIREHFSVAEDSNLMMLNELSPNLTI